MSSANYAANCSGFKEHSSMDRAKEKFNEYFEYCKGKALNRNSAVKMGIEYFKFERSNSKDFKATLFQNQNV